MEFTRAGQAQKIPRDVMLTQPVQDLSTGRSLPPECLRNTARYIGPQRTLYKFTQVFYSGIHQPEIQCSAPWPHRFGSAIRIHRGVEERDVVFSENTGISPSRTAAVTEHHTPTVHILLTAQPNRP